MRSRVTSGWAPDSDVRQSLQRPQPPANPKTAFLGGAAQFGIFATLIGALLLSDCMPGIHFDLLEAASIGIIGGADGPTSIFLTSRLAPHLLGPIAVAAYSYMALVPIIQPPIMRLLTTEKERRIRMEQIDGKKNQRGFGTSTRFPT